MEVREEIIKNQLVEGKFDICLTTYEGINICNSALKRHKWRYFVMDEAHKLKNKDSKISMLSREIPSCWRLLLTGTPLQNNLLELWALLNFMMPSVFSSSEDFQHWFVFGEAKASKEDEDDEAAKAKNLQLIESLHKLMRPFLLRRTKADLANKLPDKIEIIVNTGMSAMQFGVYESLLKSQSIFNEKTKTNQTQLMNLLMQVRTVTILNSNSFVRPAITLISLMALSLKALKSLANTLSKTVANSS